MKIASIAMAFHNPDPKLQALERRNAQLRAKAFAACFRGLKRGLSRLARLTVRVLPTGVVRRRSAAGFGRTRRLSEGYSMHSAIVGFHKDELGDWVADLECGHGQHVRHNPPWFNRPWVETEKGRREMLGQTLWCRRCERGEPAP